MLRDQRATQVKAVFHDSARTYGSPRVCVELRKDAQAISENTVARIMREEGRAHQSAIASPRVRA